MSDSINGSYGMQQYRDYMGRSNMGDNMMKVVFEQGGKMVEGFMNAGGQVVDAAGKVVEGVTKIFDPKTNEPIEQNKGSENKSSPQAAPSPQGAKSDGFEQSDELKEEAGK